MHSPVRLVGVPLEGLGAAGDCRCPSIARVTRSKSCTRRLSSSTSCCASCCARGRRSTASHAEHRARPVAVPTPISVDPLARVRTRRDCHASDPGNRRGITRRLPARMPVGPRCRLRLRRAWRTRGAVDRDAHPRAAISRGGVVVPLLERGRDGRSRRAVDRAGAGLHRELLRARRRRREGREGEVRGDGREHPVMDLRPPCRRRGVEEREFARPPRTASACTSSSAQRPCRCPPRASMQSPPRRLDRRSRSPRGGARRWALCLDPAHR